MIDNNPLSELLPSLQDPESFRWGTIVGVTPIRVQLDGDLQPLLATPETLCMVSVGDRVLARIAHRRIVIIGVRNGDSIPENSIRVDGKWWQASGIQSLPSYTWSHAGISNWYAATVRMPAPFEPPAGYGFAYSMLNTNGFTIFTTALPTANGATACRLLNFSNAKPNIVAVQWQLAKQS